MTVTRFPVAAALAAVVLLSGAAAAQEKVVNIYNWSDYIDPDVLKDFTKETGIKVVYDVYDNNEIVESKLLAGKSGYDIVVPSAANVARQIKAGTLQPVDKSKIPNLTHMWPEVMARLATYDPGNRFAVNYMWGTTGIGYNVDKVKKALPSAPVDSWDMLFKPEVAAKLKGCGIHVLDSSDDLFPAALNYLGLNPNSHAKEDLEKAGELLKKTRPNIRKFHSSEYINALAGGDICVAVGYSGDILQARNRAEEAKRKDKVKVAYSIPKEGALMWFDSFVIPKDAPHPDAAHAFIDFMERPEVAARNSDFVFYANGNKDSQPLLDPKVRNDASIYPDAEMMKKLYTTTNYEPDIQKLVTRMWTDIKRGR